MTPITILLLVVSLAVLLLGGYLWRLTSSRSIFLNTLFGSTCMLLAAYHVASHQKMEWAIMLPFFTTMLFGGRAMGTWWRSRKDADLRFPAQLMTGVAALSLTATISAYMAIQRGVAGPFSMILGVTSVLDPHPAFIIPFAALLLCIATMPLLLPKVWEHHFKKISLGLGLVAILYYLVGLHAGGRLLGVAWEYVSFIAFIGSLFVVAGGIHVRTKGEAIPSVNALYLIVGAILANLIGTTGASMLLIRPWIRMNKYRFTTFHTAFFIFVVSNVGGCLTPIGDPPLFLGYLKGVPFWWVTLKCLPAWTTAVGCIVAVFYALDRMNFLAAPRAIREKQTEHEEFKIEGLRNFGWLAVILAAVFLKQPPGLREALMIGAAIGSYRTTRQPIHDANHFSFGPIKEVAWLFAGIFATMVPALDYLECHAGALGISTPMHFYWFSGALSGVLDNAPTYLTFLTAAFGMKGLNIDNSAHVAEFLQHHGAYAIAVSLGSVFFGAMTYIGNGPNFMVKAIVDHSRVHTPNFFLYIIRYSLPILLPILALVGWIFLRG